MGIFLSAAVWRDKEKSSAVKRAADALAAVAGDPGLALWPERCSIQLSGRGVAVVLDDYCPEGEKLAEALSRELGAAVLVCGIYDSDFWEYSLFDNGTEKDRFRTVPDYFEELDERELKSWKGKPRLLRKYFRCGFRIAAYLRFWDENTRGKTACRDDEYEMGDCWQLSDFLRRLGFPAVFSEGEQEEPVPEQTVSPQVEESAKEPVPSSQPTVDAAEEKRRRLQEEEEEFYAHLPGRFTPDAGRIDTVQVWRGDEKRTFENEELTSETVARLVEEVLAGEYTRLAIHFLLHGEGVYVKRLKKTVYNTFQSTLVIHHVDGALACVFFCGDTKHCYALISDFYTYTSVDMDEVKQLPLGEAVLPEYVIHWDREPLDAALQYLFLDAATIDERLYNSRRWSSENIFLQGSNKYAQLRRTWGALED